jgi:chemotaxis protein histidine kinase CheA
VSRSDIQRLRELVGEPGGELGRLLRRLAARPFGEVIASLVDRVPGWAEAMGKRAVLQVEGKEAMVPAELARVLPGVITHLVRNAIAHGIERPGQRTLLNKPEVGVIRVTCLDERSFPVVVVEDDGRGIDFDSLAARAGVDPSDITQTRALLFTAGLTSSPEVTDLAGRGMGLCAVRSELANLGWTIEVDASRRLGTAFVIRNPAASLPPNERGLKHGQLRAHSGD